MIQEVPGFLVCLLCTAPFLSLQGPIGRSLPAPPLRPPARVWTVDASGRGDFLDLQPAIDAAGPGDTIRVRPAPIRYGTADIRKPITIMGVGPARVDVSEIQVMAEFYGRSSVVLRQLSIEPTGTLSQVALVIFFPRPFVWIEDCELRPSEDRDSSILITGLAAGINGAVLVRCDVLGGTAPAGAAPAAGLTISGATVHAFDCSFVGNSAAASPSCPAPAGGAGVLVGNRSFLFAANTTFQGGRGAATDGVLCPSGDGGPGAFMLSSDVQTLDCCFIGGAGGRGPSPGLAGPDISLGPVASPPLVASAPERHYAITPSVVRRGSDLTLDAEGQAGDLLVSLISAEVSPVFLPLHNGPLVLGAPLVVRVEGTVPPGGTLSRSFRAASPSATSLTAFFQGAFFSSAGDATLSEPSAVLVAN